MTDEKIDKKQKVDVFTATESKCTSDVKGPLPCSATREDIQLIPVRYAYTDEPANHLALNSQYELGFQPIGIRQIRDGYLYLFHSDSPDIMHEYEVSKGGAVTKRLWEGGDAAQDTRKGQPDIPAIIVPRSGYVHVLFSADQLTAKKCSMLIQWADYRSQVMRKIELNDYCPATAKPHLISKPELEKILSRSHKKEVPMDGRAKLEPWYWAQDTLDGENEPFAYRLSAYEQDHAYLVVDDLRGHITDLLDAWAIIDTNHNAWLEQEDDKYYPACFISNLIRMDSDRFTELAEALAQQINDDETKAEFEKVTLASDAQKSELAKLVIDYPEYERSRNFIQAPESNWYNMFPYLDKNRDEDIVEKMRKGIDKLSEELEISPSILEKVIKNMSEYREELVHGSNWTGKRGIADLVQLDPMTTYLEKAQLDLQWYAQEKERIVKDIKSLLEFFYLHGHLYDREDDNSYTAFLGVDNALITVINEQAQTTGDFDFITNFYFNEIGHQHLVSIDLKPISYQEKTSGLLLILKSILDAKESPAAYADWNNVTENNPYLRFPSLSAKSAEELSTRLASLQMPAKLKLYELVVKADAAKFHGRLQQIFKNMSPGLRSYIFGNQLIYEIDLKFADADILAQHEALVSEIERLNAKLKGVITEQENHEQVLRNAKSNEHRKRQFGPIKKASDRQFSHILNQKQSLENQLRERALKLIDTTPLQGQSNSGALLIGGLTRTAHGQALLDEINHINSLKQRGGLQNVWDYGRGMIYSNDSLDVPKRIGGLGLISFLGLISGIGAWDAYNKWKNEDDFENFLPLFSGVSSTIGAAVSVITIIGSARLNYYYQNVSKIDQVLVRLARLNVWGGTIAAWAGFFTAGADFIKQGNIILDKNSNAGVKSGAGVSLVGDALILHGSRVMAMEGSVGIYNILWKGAENITWQSVRTNMLGLAGGIFRGLNVYLWIGTGLVVAGNWVQNYFQRSEVESWCEQSHWGNKSQSWTTDQQRHELAKAIYKPTLSVMAERHSSNGNMTYCAFRLELPGLSELHADTMEWAVFKKQGKSWVEDHTYWNQAITKGQHALGGLTLQLVLRDADLEPTTGYYLAFRYRVAGTNTWLPDAADAYYYKLMLYEGGKLPTVAANEDKKWQIVKPLKQADPQHSTLITRYHALINEPEIS